MQPVWNVCISQVTVDLTCPDGVYALFWCMKPGNLLHINSQQCAKELPEFTAVNNINV